MKTFKALLLALLVLSYTGIASSQSASAVITPLPCPFIENNEPLVMVADKSRMATLTSGRLVIFEKSGFCRSLVESGSPSLNGEVLALGISSSLPGWNFRTTNISLWGDSVFFTSFDPESKPELGEIWPNTAWALDLNDPSALPTKILRVGDAFSDGKIQTLFEVAPTTEGLIAYLKTSEPRPGIYKVGGDLLFQGQIKIRNVLLENFFSFPRHLVVAGKRVAFYLGDTEISLLDLKTGEVTKLVERGQILFAENEKGKFDSSRIRSYGGEFYLLFGKWEGEGATHALTYVVWRSGSTGWSPYFTLGDEFPPEAFVQDISGPMITVAKQESSVTYSRPTHIGWIVGGKLGIIAELGEQFTKFAYPIAVSSDTTGYFAAQDQNGVWGVYKTGETTADPNAPLTAAITDAAGFALGVSPCAISSIFGSRLATDVFVAENTLPTELGGTSVIVNGGLVPLWFVSPSQINFQFPCETEVGSTVTIRVHSGDLTSPDWTETVLSATPGVFKHEGIGIVTDASWNIVAEKNPARAGGAYVAFATGLGITEPPAQTGLLASQVAPAVLPVTLTIDGRETTVHYAGLTPGSIGLYQFNFTLPGISGNGEARLVDCILTAGTQSTTFQIWIK